MINKITGSTPGAINKPNTDANKAPRNGQGEQSEQATSPLRELNIDQLRRDIAATPEVDRSRVDAIKQALANGEFQVNSDNVADAMLRMESFIGME